jgi:hypothetical protein
MKVVSKVTLATILILAPMHSSQAWTGNDVRNAGAIIVLGQRLTCRDEPTGMTFPSNPPSPEMKRICSRTVRGSELPGQVKNRRWSTTGGYACESEVYRDERGGPLVKLACKKTFAGAPSR